MLDIIKEKIYNYPMICLQGETMINSNAFSYINVLEKAADATNTRLTVINNNLANATTPNYKRRDVSFENYLLEELTSGSNTCLRAKVGDVDISNLYCTTYTDYSNLSYRLDGNNVDVDTENVELASAQIKYDGLISSIEYQFDMLRAAMQK